MSPATEPDDDAGSRARAADARAHELRERLARIKAGEPTTEEDVEHARQAAIDSALRDERAHERAAAAHRRAADAHRSAAAVAERSGQSERAREHRSAADADDRAGIADDDAANDGTPDHAQ